MLGDVSGSAGMGALFLGLSSLVRDVKADFVIINGENASAGFGIAVQDYQNLKKMGADVITSGNHIWQKDEIFSILEGNDDILRPLNYPEPCIGHGYTVRKKGAFTIAVINAQGRVMMSPIDDPFKRVDKVLRDIKKETPLVFVDFHAEDTLEKEAFAFAFDGRVTAVVGTHTHVQTADEKILPGGCAYITDLGITGVTDAVIGSDPQKSIERQLTQLPIKSEVASGESHIQGVVIEADATTGKAVSIERIDR
ncbi:MAG: TIGR00282 family metallophosphoesterase [Spirochaetes bacterium]|uniref:TIGR00282 family metallophosphoesterase n=1 Tax=Candidatus Ornithospirochaeta stercoripullorum TaxID=2840899 RepID=A0A9D9DZL5_9SPIO|nr:TIGR00282 family metallophosphoesterase [Candidatus Ornithospirochaeta stercoripullorum]